MFLTAILCYLGLLTVAAVWQSRRVRTAEDFLVAGRTLPARVLVFTLLSTWIGAGSLFAGAGLAYRTGFSALWTAVGAWAGLAVMYSLAPRVRQLADYTVPELLERRYGVAARLLATIALVLAYTTIAAYQFRAGGRLLNLASRLDPLAGAVIIAAFCVAYAALAGMRSVASLDVGNGLIMLAGTGVAVVYLTGHAGGFGPALAALRPEQSTVFGTLSPLQAVALFVPTLCLLLGEASMYQKLFSARDGRAARAAVAGWIVATILLQTLIVAIGALGSVVVPRLNPIQSDTIVVRVARDVLPAAFGMLLLAGGAAIIVSTASSFLLTPATSLVRDVYQRFVDPHADDARLVALTRGFVVALGVIGVVIGNFFPRVLATTLWAYTMYGAGVTPALLAAMIWPAATRSAGLASIAAGMSMTVAWELIAVRRGGYLFGIQAIYPALVLSVGTLIGVSRARRAGQPAVGQPHLYD